MRDDGDFAVGGGFGGGGGVVGFWWGGEGGGEGNGRGEGGGEEVGWVEGVAAEGLLVVKRGRAGVSWVCWVGGGSGERGVGGGDVRRSR